MFSIANFAQVRSKYSGFAKVEKFTTLFLGYKQKNQKPVFKIRESLLFLNINLKWRAKFLISQLLIRNSD